MYPRILHKGPAHDRQIKRVEDEAEHKAAAKKGWADKPAAWTGEEPSDDDEGGDGADDKRKIPAVKTAAEKKADKAAKAAKK